MRRLKCSLQWHRDAAACGGAYSVLEIDESAPISAVKKQYRQRARELHPDRKTGSTAEFQSLHDAYQVILRHRAEGSPRGGGKQYYSFFKK